MQRILLSLGVVCCAIAIALLTMKYAIHKELTHSDELVLLLLMTISGLTFVTTLGKRQ